MKKWFSLVLILLLVVALCSACGKPDVATGDDVLDEEVEENMGNEEEIEEVVEEEPEILGESEEDPLYILSTTWEIANENESGGLFLLRNGELYTLGEFYQKNPSVDYLPGMIIASGKLPTFYINNSKEYGDRSVGDVPIPLLGENDKIIAISRVSVPVLKLFPVELGGYSFLLDDDNSYVTIRNLWEKNDMIAIPRELFETVEIMDKEGNVYSVKDCLNNLEKNQVYTLSWYQGTTLNQEEVVANSRVFYWSGYGYTGDDYYEVEGTLTTDGYAEYDVSSVPSGVYKVFTDSVYSGGLIEIP